MSTPVAERNIKRLCDALDVKLITVKANTGKKLANVRKNISAWIRKPDLGLIPLFMAGDKQFFRHANAVAKEHELNTVFLGANPFEKTDFKTGFCGVAPNFDAERIFLLTRTGKQTMLLHYARAFLTNPAYVNTSLPDTVSAFFSFYQTPQEQIDLFQYIPWDEETINSTLVNTYGWETDPGCMTTWRIGDGTAAFYNYIYYTAAGFTENDTLRSNQIRAGVLTRAEGLEKCRAENRPRETSILWYLERVGLDAGKVISAVNAMPKLYRGVSGR